MWCDGPSWWKNCDEGGDVVLVDGENLRDEVQRHERAPIRLALNAVGGDNALRVAKTLASDGTMVTYGAMSLQPLCVPNGMFIFKNLRFTGFWVNKWYEPRRSSNGWKRSGQCSRWRSAACCERKWKRPIRYPKRRRRSRMLLRTSAAERLCSTLLR